MSALNVKDIEVINQDGVKTFVPADHVLVYSTIKTEQLRAINSIIASHTGGATIKVDNDAVSALAGIAEELANICNETMYSLTNAVELAVMRDAKTEKGGEQ